MTSKQEEIGASKKQQQQQQQQQQQHQKTNKATKKKKKKHLNVAASPRAWGKEVAGPAFTTPLRHSVFHE